MDAREMQIYFERRVQLISPDLVTDGKLTSDTIFTFINAAQDRYTVMNYVGDDQNLTETNRFNKNVDAIKSLVTEVILYPSDKTPSGLVMFDLPSTTTTEYYLYVSSLSKVTGTYKEHATEKTVANNLVKYIDIDKYLHTAYNVPIIREPAAALMSNPKTGKDALVIAVDNYTTLNNIILTYYRKPLRINVIPGKDIINKCELPESIHNEIVELAVEMFITEAKYKLATKRSE